jgi:phenylalanyl-tRNA synthetase beta chain
MKVSYNQLNTYFDGALPAPAVVADACTFHAWEIEEVIDIAGDTILDIKVLPDKAAWALSHRGVAKDLSVVLNLPLAHDPLAHEPSLEPRTEKITISLHTANATRYSAALVEGVTIGSSPQWLRDFLKSIGQRSINNVVDATNFVMYTLGQPLHAFDAGKLQHVDGTYALGVRSAHAGEHITTLTGETYQLTADDAVVVDAHSDTPIAIAGIKGGKSAEVDAQTRNIIIESAHFHGVAVRKTSARLKLRTDASARYENGVVPQLTAYGLQDVVTLITDIAGGMLVGYADSEYVAPPPTSVTLTLDRLSRVLGVSMTNATVEEILVRFGYAYTKDGDSYVVTIPFERTDIIIEEDLIEEIARIYGYEHITAVPVAEVGAVEVNQHYYYCSFIRDFLSQRGFSEVFTSSFREHDEVPLANALAADKGYLRSALVPNLAEVLQKNAPFVELFGTDTVKVFEIGTVFTNTGEAQKIAIGTTRKAGLHPKDFAYTQGIVRELLSALGTQTFTVSEDQALGVIEIDLDALIATLPVQTAYTPYRKSGDVTYVPFSPYPHMVRDVAFWSSTQTSQEDAQKLLEAHAGPLLYRIDCFDRFQKDGRVSYGFRLVFLSYEKTLTIEEVNVCMEAVYTALREAGCEVR